MTGDALAVWLGIVSRHAAAIEIGEGIVARRGLRHTSLAALGESHACCEALLAAECLRYPTLDRRAQAAFMLGRLVRTVCLPIAVAVLRERIVPISSPAAIEIIAQAVARRGDSGSVEMAHLEVGFTEAIGAVCEGPDAMGEMLHEQLARCFAPVVDHLSHLSGLPRGAFWRLVADMVCSAFLRAGEHAGCLAEARAIALAATRRHGSPMNNGRSGFQLVTLVDDAHPARILAERWFITRGGCCRWYTSKGGELCSICVLRTPAEQQARLRDHLRETLPAPS